MINHSVHLNRPSSLLCSRCLKLKKLIKRYEAEEVGDEPDRLFLRGDYESGPQGTADAWEWVFFWFSVSAQYRAPSIHNPDGFGRFIHHQCS